MKIFTEIIGMTSYNLVMPAHIAKSYTSSWKECRTVESGDIYPVIYKTTPEATEQEIGRLLLVHCPEEEDRVELVACPSPEKLEDLPVDERELAEFYELQRRLAQPDMEADNYVRRFRGPEVFYAKLKSARSGLFDLLIRHVPDT